MVPGAVVGCPNRVVPMAETRWPRSSTGRVCASQPSGNGLRAPAPAGSIQSIARSRVASDAITRAVTFRVGVNCTSTGVALPTTRCAVAMRPLESTTVPEACVLGVQSDDDAVLPLDQQVPLVGLAGCAAGVDGAGGRRLRRWPRSRRASCRSRPRRRRLAPFVGLALEHERVLGLDRVVARRQRHARCAVARGHDAPRRPARRVVAHEKRVSWHRPRGALAGVERRRDAQDADSLRAARVTTGKDEAGEGDEADE